MDSPLLAEVRATLARLARLEKELGRRAAFLREVARFLGEGGDARVACSRIIRGHVNPDPLLAELDRLEDAAARAGNIASTPKGGSLDG